jgi:hypothetical protein
MSTVAVTAVEPPYQPCPDTIDVATKHQPPPKLLKSIDVLETSIRIRELQLSIAMWPTTSAHSPEISTNKR